MTQPLRKTDGELLAQFSADHSQPAFAELVNRHGAMVHGVAWRVLADHHERRTGDTGATGTGRYLCAVDRQHWRSHATCNGKSFRVYRAP